MTKMPNLSRKLIYSMVAVAVVLLLAAVAIPNFVYARFTSSGEPLAFQVRVVAEAGGSPVRGAEVEIKLKKEITDADGYCHIVYLFPAQGIVGRSGRCYLSGTLRVTAPGFLAWEKELASLFGASYDYFNQGTQITHVVTLLK
jgi:hypothetical protein